METKRNIGYDLEAISYHNGNTTTTIEVLATCEEGSKTFYLDFCNKHLKCNDDNINDFIDDADLTEIETWVDETTIGYLSSELQKWCIRKTETGKYYSFSMFTFNTVSCVVNGMESDRLCLNGKTFFSNHLVGEEQIKEFLRLNK